MKSSLAKYLKVFYIVVLSLLGIGITFYKADFSLLGMIGPMSAIALFGAWFAIIGKLLQSYLATIFSLVTLQIINQTKIYYFKSRLFFTDFVLMFDTNNFDTLNQYWGMVVITALFISIVGVTLYLFRKGRAFGLKARSISFLIFVLLSSGIYQITLSKENIASWQTKLPNGKGVIINLWMTINGMHYESPIYQGDSQLFLEKAAEVTLESDLKVKPDIVVFLQESTVDRDYFDIKDAKLPKLSMFDPSASFLTAYGPLRVQTTGGGTWLSEFSFATGLDTNDFGHRKHSVFYTVAPHIQTSFYQELKNNGYFTVLLTPMTKDNYNTREAYENFGIDLVLQPQDLGYDANINSNLWDITSEQMLDYVAEILEAYSEKPVAVFMLSMNEHGPYDEESEDQYNLLPHLKDEKVARRLNDYLQRQEALNKATDKFSNQMLNRERPTLFLYFGDHQPALYGKAVREDLFSNPLYATQFFMKDNLSNEAPFSNSITDINFLGGLILERINAQVSPYYEANIKMRYLCDGKLSDCENSDLIQSYKHYIYNVLKVADYPSE